MTWRRLLPVSMVLAILLVGVGLWVGGRSGCSEGFRWTTRPGGALCTTLESHPFRGSFRGEVNNDEGGRTSIDDPGDQRWWYFAAGAVVALSLIPSLSRRKT